MFLERPNFGHLNSLWRCISETPLAKVRTRLIYSSQLTVSTASERISLLGRRVIDWRGRMALLKSNVKEYRRFPGFWRSTQFG
jgi:hypothetical protein